MRLLSGFVIAAVALLSPVGVSDASGSPAHQPCPAQQDISSCDADGDTIPDTVERVVAGSPTAAGALRDLITGLATRRDTLDAVREFDRMTAGIGANLNLLGLVNSLSGMLTHA